MPNVLILCEHASLNGGERSMLSVLGTLGAAGFSLSVAGPLAGPLADAVAEHHIAFVPLELHGPSGSRLDLEVCRQRVREVIAAAKADLVHANSLAMSRIAGPVTADLRVASLGHLRDMVNVNARVIADLNRHTRLLAVSHATRDWYVARGVDQGKTHVAHNGVDLDRFRPRSANGYLHRELGLPADVPIVGSVGQIGIRKGLDTLLRAASEIARAEPEVHFAIVGRRYSHKAESVEFERLLRDLASASSLNGRVHFLGVRDDVHRLLNEFTLLAHAARQEPLGRVLLEAAASGTPVVATAVGGTREIFGADPCCALLVPPDEPAGLAAAIVRLLTDTDLRARLSHTARQRAERAFDARSAALALAAHYRQILDGPRDALG